MMSHRTISVLSVLLSTALVFLIADVSAGGATAFRAETSILGESAIIDKTTGRIYWDSNTLAASLGPRLRSVIGVHFRATILSIVLWVAVWGRLVDRLGWETHLEQLVQKHSTTALTTEPHQYTSWIVTVLLSCAHTLLHSTPRCHRFLLMAAIALYLLESYQCSTRQYLSHTVSDVESCITQLRSVDPVIEWRVRSFHYENPMVRVLWNMPREMIQRIVSPRTSKALPIPTNTTTTISTNTTSTDSQIQPNHTLRAATPSLWRCWKVVTDVSRHRYNYTACTDRTVAGVWKRASPLSPTTKASPPLKVRVTKTVLLRDPKTRVDYFRQLRAFLRSTQGLDVLSECTTTILVPGYTSRYLQMATTTTRHQWYHRHVPMALFWLATVCGWTVPFRRWMDARCDQVRVTVVKETGSTSSTASKQPGSTAASFAFQQEEE